MSPSPSAPTGPALFQQDLLDLRKHVDPTVPILPKPREESTEHARSWLEPPMSSKSINGRSGSGAGAHGDS